MTESIQIRMEKIIKEIKPSKDMEIKMDTDLFETGILDSFGMIEYLSAVEKEFNIKISNEDLIPQNLWSIEASIQTVRKYLQ